MTIFLPKPGDIVEYRGMTGMISGNIGEELTDCHFWVVFGFQTPVYRGPQFGTPKGVVAAYTDSSKDIIPGAKMFHSDQLSDLQMPTHARFWTWANGQPNGIEKGRETRREYNLGVRTWRVI